MEVIVIRPETLEFLMRYAEKKKELQEEIWRVTETVKKGFEEIGEALKTITENITSVFYDDVAKIVEQIAQAVKEAGNDEKKKRRAWRIAETRQSRDAKLKYALADRERANRPQKSPGDINIGGCGRRVGNKRAKRYKAKERRREYATGKQNDGRNN